MFGIRHVGSAFALGGLLLSGMTIVIGLAAATIMVAVWNASHEHTPIPEEDDWIGFGDFHMGL